MDRRRFFTAAGCLALAPFAIAGLRDRTDLDPLEKIPDGAGVIFGVVPCKQIWTGLPGRMRLRLRVGELASAFVRHEGQTRHFHIFEVGDHWELGLEQGQNITVQSA